MRITYNAALLPSLVALVLAVIAYAAPFENTGVNGSIGALLALIGAVATVAGTVLVMVLRVGRRLWVSLNLILLIGAGLTTVAAYFLMQYAFAVMMLLTCVALVFALVWNLRKKAA
ncbi:hypothetical protein [Rhizobium halophilum]|uniref:hypothetical protein n=1 Tax=Rhizobium halophilum TaxID=2846852 RepID=UPI001EFCFE74|nr:hypothetical protein [Rhizobium halophilum]MCF6370681.1 hypothetical protein [Rhizobium halophilum]